MRPTARSLAAARKTKPTRRSAGGKSRFCTRKRFRPSAAIFSVAQQRMAAEGKLRADLMRAAGVQAHADKTHALPHAKHAVVEHRVFPCRIVRLRRIGHAPHAVIAEPHCQRPLGRIRLPADHGKIFLLKFSLPNLLRQDGAGHARAREYHHAARRRVQPVHRAHARVRIAKRLTQKRRHPARLVNRHHACGLETDQNPAVLTENGHARLPEFAAASGEDPPKVKDVYIILLLSTTRKSVCAHFAHLWQFS
mgnify:CR=1 FL=1